MKSLFSKFLIAVVLAGACLTTYAAVDITGNPSLHKTNVHGMFRIPAKHRAKAVAIRKATLASTPHPAP